MRWVRTQRVESTDLFVLPLVNATRKDVLDDGLQAGVDLAFAGLLFGADLDIAVNSFRCEA